MDACGGDWDMSKGKGRRVFHQPKQFNPPPSPMIANTFQRAVALHQQGRLEEAETLYQSILKLAPNQFDALHFLGLIEHQRKHLEAAAELIGRALKVNPKFAGAHSNLGLVLRDLKRPKEALASYDRALALEPGHVEALNNRGTALSDLKRYDEAVASYDRALKLKPDSPSVLNNRGIALRDLKRPEEALASYDRALAIMPGYAEALNNRGNALLDLKRTKEALASFDRALAIVPVYADALNNRGNALLHLNRPDEALVAYDRAIEIRPNYAEALNNRGNALIELKRHEEALASYDRALTCNPDHSDALNNWGNTLRDLNRPEEALAGYDRALTVKPDNADALNNLGNALQDLKRHEEAIKAFERLLGVRPDYDYARGTLQSLRLHCCDWQDYDRNVEPIVSDVVAGKRAATPFIFLALSGSPGAQLQCAQTFSRDKYAAAGPALWQGERYGHDRIRVAYLSADFYNHATAYLIAELFETHDKARFETTAISFGPDSSNEWRTRLENSFDRFIDVRRHRDRDTAVLLRELEIDIAVDLKGYTQDSRAGILSYRPAPIQVNFLGYPGTMGADYIDYIVADRIIIPDDQQRHYAEKVVCLPDSYQPNDRKRRIGEHAPTRVAAGLPETGFVFCSFNNNYKIVPPVFDVWMRLLQAVEGSVLWLLADNAVAVRNLRQEAERRGVAPDRLIFAPRMKPEDHLARHRLADLFLDTIPINAHTTASDALWAGLPIVTCLGSAFAGRVAASLLSAVGLSELIADNLADYEALALELARDEDRLAAIRAKLAQNRENFPLFDTDRFCRHIESAYETMWQRYQRGEPPTAFAVPAG
jgi:protein O-GlcNAc transferase